MLGSRLWFQISTYAHLLGVPVFRDNRIGSKTGHSTVVVAAIVVAVEVVVVVEGEEEEESASSVGQFS